MDIITKNFLNDYSKKYNLTNLKEADQFELFSNFCIFSKEYGISFKASDTLTGPATQGIDGFGVIVNNKLCSSVSEIKDLIDTNNYLVVTFVAIQTKTSSKFDNKQLGNFFNWIKIFFSKENSIFETEEMKNFIEMKDFIYNNSAYFTFNNPSLKLFFVSTGNWNNDENITAIINSNKKELLEKNLFTDIVFTPYGAKEIQNLYRRTMQPVQANIKMEKKVTLPSIPGVKVAYFGFLPYNEFSKIIMDEDGNMKSIFEDNVRDYLQTKDNEVNKDIIKTLNSGNFESFSILNNGVTVVAEEVRGIGEDTSILNYQVVNGCQTSHVLYESRNLTGIEEVYVPLKVIVTDNQELKSKITRATNNQTAVGVEELEALSNFQRELEMYYNALQEAGLVLYYERRTNQYRGKNIEQYRVVSIESQVKSLAAMFLEEPHLVTGYYGRLNKKMGTKTLFNPEHSFSPYFTSALTYFSIEELFDRNVLDKKYRRFRYHLILLFKLQVAGWQTPHLNNKKKIDSYCDKIIEALKDPIKKEETFIKAIEILKNCIKDFGDRKVTEKKDTTESLTKYFKPKETLF